MKLSVKLSVLSKHNHIKLKQRSIIYPFSQHKPNTVMHYRSHRWGQSTINFTITIKATQNYI